MTMLVVRSENSGCDPLFLFPGIGVATWLFLPLLHFYVGTSIRCRDIISVVSLFNSWSHLLFQVATSFSCLEPSSRLQLKFAGLLSCRDVDIRS